MCYKKMIKDIFFIKWREEYEHIFVLRKKMKIFRVPWKIVDN